MLTPLVPAVPVSGMVYWSEPVVVPRPVNPAVDPVVWLQAVPDSVTVSVPPPDGVSVWVSVFRRA